MPEEYNESRIKYGCDQCDEFKNGLCRKYNITRNPDQLVCKAFYFG